ncbi:MAG: ABC transporter permease [Lachnospiraceae bacterium]|nr:ABC transporter permease [Lachnospiraceae bacterium]
MKQFGIVWKHEFLNYVKTKSFIGITAGFALLFVIILSLPSFFDLSGLIPGLPGGQTETEYEEQVPDAGSGGAMTGADGSIRTSGYEGTIYLCDAGGQVGTEFVAGLFPSARVVEASSEEELKTLVEEGDAALMEAAEAIGDGESEGAGGPRCGFFVESLGAYRYYVKNRSFSDQVEGTFVEGISYLYRNAELEKLGADSRAVERIYGFSPASETIVLGKDSISNFLYTYLMIFVLYFMVLLYGNSVAVSVAQEKSNRAMEVLVTSTSSNSLIFGKVLAGAAAGFVQTGVMIGAALASYQLNREAWGGMLDFVFHIPGTVLLAFAMFGLFGYILYAFCYGVLGALVSKTEDVSRNAGPVMFLFVAAFLLTMFNLQNSDGIVMKVLSFIPFTSPYGMFVRVAMGNVALWEIALSFLLLLGTVWLVAGTGAKIYRMGTLMYGNPIKLSRAFRMSREKNQ